MRSAVVVALVGALAAAAQSPPSSPPAAARDPRYPTVEETLAEVNAARARRGLPPFQLDPALAAGAVECSRYRAAHGIEGHTRNDFAFLPPGARASAAGCAAWHPSLGWGSCCAYDRYRYAGAAWTMGRDGRRYMHLFVR